MQTKMLKSKLLLLLFFVIFGIYTHAQVNEPEGGILCMNEL